MDTSDDYESDDGGSNDQNGPSTSGPPRTTAAPPKKTLTVEKIYQKKSQLEHILLRPDTYIGSVQRMTENMWVYDPENKRMVQKEIQYVPGLFKIFDEILVNAADNKQRDDKMDTIKISIDREKNVITIWNNGKGIPVVEHKDEKMYVLTMIFGHLLTSSNYNDEEEKVTGGRNGYGAKLCNIFSTKFTVETASKDDMKRLKQTWMNNMSTTSAPQITTMSSGKDFTQITFSPDLQKFNMTELEEGIVEIMERRAFDVAASTRGVKVILNGEQLKIKSFKDYCELYLKGHEDDCGSPLNIAYESPNVRWEVALALSPDKGFQQVSFVNSIATSKGGRHVDYVADLIVKELLEVIKKKNKSTQVKPFQVKHHMFLFINCLIVNPTFDSQTKENMTLQMKSFGSKCNLSPKFFKAVNSQTGIAEAVATWAKFKEEDKLKKQGGKKTNKVKNILKLEDANDAGTKNSINCTLILTEGDSAKTLAVAGLAVVGRDEYGVFPLRGKVLNVREASMKQIMDNAEIKNLIQILGLQYKKKYNSLEDVKSLRYGKVMIMTDQDQDGSHIKGLLINFLHFFWPELLRLPFLEEFITPIVKATKGNEVKSFYSLPEFEEWKKNTPNWHKYHVKYYKGLGTSTSNEAVEYFHQIKRHRIKFRYQGNEDDQNICLAFSKKEVDRRKEWLTDWMLSCKRRQELGLPEEYLYGKTTSEINYSEFINKELVLFSNTDNERSIPSVVDGLKPGQRKVLFTCLKRNDKREVKVAQLAGSVAEHSSYHHGEASLMGTIINLAQDFVGSNNINLLMPNGQFGTRLMGGKDAASPRYIFTMLSPVAKLILNPADTPLLHTLYDDNQKIEPRWYIPIIPMILVNGADGIGTGWMTKILNHNPREIVANLKRMLHGDEPVLMKPWYKNYRGVIENLGDSRYIAYGEVAVLDEESIEITELPLMTWTSSYKGSTLEPMTNPSENARALITGYSEYSTDTTVRFVVNMVPEDLRKAQETGLHKFFKLQTSLSTASMVAFDESGCLRKYDSVQTILKEFFKLRLTYYNKRKTYMEGWLQAEALKLTNQARFIIEKCSNKIIVENKKKAVIIKELKEKKYDPDPERAWRLKQDKDALLDEEQQENQNDDDDGSAADYSYLLSLSLWTLTLERKEELLKKRDQKKEDLRILQAKSPEDLWEADLNELLEKLEKHEEDERQKAQASLGKCLGKVGKGKKQKGEKKAKFTISDTLPCAAGQRIVPTLDEETKKKVEKLDAAKLRPPEEKSKLKRRESDLMNSEDKDDIDLMIQESSKPLGKRLRTLPDATEKKVKKGEALKQRKLNPLSQTMKKTHSIKSEFKSESDDDSDVVNVVVSPRERPSQRQAAKRNYVIESSSNSSDEEEFHDANRGNGHEEAFVISDIDDNFKQSDEEMLADKPEENFLGPKPTKSTKTNPKQKAKNVMICSESDSDEPQAQLPVSKSTKTSLKPKVKEVMIFSESDSDEFQAPLPKSSSDQNLNSIVSSSKTEEAECSSPKPKKIAAPKKRQLHATSLNEKPVRKIASQRKKAKIDSDSDEDNLFIKPSRKRGGDSESELRKKASSESARGSTTGRQRKPVLYSGEDSSN